MGIAAACRSEIPLTTKGLRSILWPATQKVLLSVKVGGSGRMTAFWRRKGAVYEQSVFIYGGRI